jgi:hypothetical protein
VGRSAAGRALAPNALTLAVVASVRHLDTPYDRLLMSGTPRQDARDAVREKVAAIIDGWRSQASAEIRAESRASDSHDRSGKMPGLERPRSRDG